MGETRREKKIERKTTAKILKEPVTLLIFAEDYWHTEICIQYYLMSILRFDYTAIRSVSHFTEGKININYCSSCTYKQNINFKKSGLIFNSYF